MERRIVRIADNIISPLGMTSGENYCAVKAGKSALRFYCKGDGREMGGVEPFTASLLDRETIGTAYAEAGLSEGTTFFEKAVLLSACKALENTGIDTASDRVVFILSSTKGNVSLLEKGDPSDPRIPIHHSAELIARHFGNRNRPIVISNACISGVCALIEGMRALRSGRYDYAVVTGGDILSEFIISGFQSFKALSPEPCKPFDKNRKGLNLGEAAATVVLKALDSKPDSQAVIASGRKEVWELVDGCIRNDANHISGPSRTGEGSWRALDYLLEKYGKEELAMINVHGTSTLYNDEMESIALERAGLGEIPVNALKGYYGHTLGAAGIMETIISMKALDDGTVIGTRGYGTCGVSGKACICARNRATDKKAFIKLLSGFGGCNAALMMKKGGLVWE